MTTKSIAAAFITLIAVGFLLAALQFFIISNKNLHYRSNASLQQDVHDMHYSLGLFLDRNGISR